MENKSKMFRIICMMLHLCSHIVNAQPLSCKEDAHCSEGYYCKIEVHVCCQCLKCEDLNRFVPELHVWDACITSVETCGPCFEGFVNIYTNGVKAKCVSPELLQFESKSYCIYVWMTATIAGSLIVVVFVYVLWKTYVFRIVPYYDPVLQPKSEAEAPTEVPPNNHLRMKKMLRFFKNLNGQQF